MANGGSRKSVGDDGRDGRRSRTTDVIDQLLSRGPMSAGLATTTDDAGHEPWASLFDVLHQTAPSILEGHLTWLVARAEGENHRPSQRILMEDETRILIRALEDDDGDEAVIRALEQPWTAGIVGADDEAVAGYASGLRAAATGHPDLSPLVALATSADHMADELFDLRGSSLATRRVG